MELYTFLRHMADSWFLLAMTLFFVGAILWAFRPSARSAHREAAESIFRNERQPVSDGPDARSQTKGA
ncbi:MAG: cbb3-type cytochrome c oxidase subunit 3 [Paracoccaceae bacterium]